METPIKLNLGCGLDHKKNWINADIDPNTQPQLLLDLQKKLPFPGEAVSEILLQDVLEHLTSEQGEVLLRECARVLEKDGKITIRVPNVFQIIKQFHHDPEVMMEFLYGTTKNNGVWGAHKVGFSKQSLANLLKRTGFCNINIQEETTNLVAKASKSIQTVTPKILIVQQSPDWGGAEEWMATLINKFAAKGIKIKLITNLRALCDSVSLQKTTKTTHLPIILDIIGNSKGLIKAFFLVFPATFWYIKALIQAKIEGYNLVLMSGFSEKLLVTWLATCFRLPVIWYEYGPLTTVFRRNLNLPKILYRLSKHLPKRVITISNYTKQNLITEARISLSKLVVITPGVTQTATSNKIQDTRSKILNTLTVGSLSRLTPEKGQRWLLEAWREVAKQLPQARLVIAGRGPDVDNLKNQISKLKVSESVKLLGFIPDQEKARFYQSLDVFVFPSVWEMEGFGMVAIEALNQGVPVVATNQGPIPEIITADVGVLVTPNQVHTLAEQIIWLLTHSDIRKQMARTAKARANKQYNLEIQIERLLTLCNDVVLEHA